MSTNQNKTTLLCTIILTMAGAFNISAQSTAAVNGLTAMQDSTREAKETSAEKKSVLPTEDKDFTSGSAAVSKVKPLSEATDPAAEEKRDATNKAAHARQQPDLSDKWQLQFTPYIWLPSLNGNVGVGNRSTSVNESFSDLLHALNFVFMGTFEASKGKFVLLTDFEYVSVSDTKATPGPLFANAEAKIKDVVFDPEVGYRIYSNPDKRAAVDVLGGMRIWHVNAELNFGTGILPAVEAQGTRNWVDAVGGLRARIALSKKFFLTGKFDAGGGGSKFTFQLFGGVGYSVNQRFALIFGYRDLDVNYNKNSFIYDISQRGPIVGLGFRF